ncbi:hypothetical protein N7507_006119 [Penicillium longicatenatum]|nr:hypothetical protein N7507_006119 [Penicillium longicatenatum]
MPQRSHLTITRPSLVSDSPTSNFPSEIYHDEQQGTENWLTTAGDRQPPSPHDFPTGESHEE